MGRPFSHMMLFRDIQVGSFSILWADSNENHSSGGVEASASGMFADDSVSSMLSSGWR